MKIEDMNSAVKSLYESQRAKLSEEYKEKLDNYITRTTNVKHIIKLLNEDDTAKALDDRESKRKSNQAYQAKKTMNENDYISLFKKNFDLELTNADFDSLLEISRLLQEKVLYVTDLLKEGKKAKVAELEAKLKHLKAL